MLATLAHLLNSLVYLSNGVIFCAQGSRAHRGGGHRREPDGRRERVAFALGLDQQPRRDRALPTLARRRRGPHRRRAQVDGSPLGRPVLAGFASLIACVSPSLIHAHAVLHSRLQERPPANGGAAAERRRGPESARRRGLRGHPPGRAVRALGHRCVPARQRLRPGPARQERHDVAHVGLPARLHLRPDQVELVNSEHLFTTLVSLLVERTLNYTALRATACASLALIMSFVVRVFSALSHSY